MGDLLLENRDLQLFSFLGGWCCGEPSYAIQLLRHFGLHAAATQFVYFSCGYVCGSQDHMAYDWPCGLN